MALAISSGRANAGGGVGRMLCAAVVLLVTARGTALGQSAVDGLPAPADRPDVLAAAEPGAVTTVAVPLPGALVRGGDRLRYTIHAGPGVRVFGSGEGTISPSDDAPSILPVTLALASDHPAGEFIAARIEIRGAAGAETLDVPVGVRTQRKLVLSVDAAGARVPPGGTVVLRYSVANLGNAADTVRLAAPGAPGWRVEASGESRVLARGDTAVGTVRVTAPEDAEPGMARVVRLTAVGRGAESAASATVGVVEEHGALADWVRMPMTAFIGTSTGAGVGGTALERAALALRADGSIDRHTELSLTYRRRPPGPRTSAFREALSGPRLRVALRRPSWDVAFGDVYQSGGLLGDRYMQGRGVDMRVRRERVGMELTAARPLRFGESAGAGHFLRAQGDLELGAGALGLVLGSAGRPREDGADHRVESLGMTYSLRDGGRHRLDAEAGLLRSTSAGRGATLGPAVDASYSYHGPRRSLSVRLRNVPGTVSRAHATTNELTVGGSTALIGGVGLSALAYAQTAPAPPGRSGLSTHGGSLGVRYDRFGGYARLGGAYRRSSGGPFLLGDTERRSVVAGFRLPAGPLALRGSAETGRVDMQGGPRGFRRFRTSVQWNGPGARARLGTAYTADEFGPARFQLDLSGAASLRAVRVEGGAGAVIGQRGATSAPRLWSAVAAPVGGLELIGGIDYRPWAAGRSDWTGSLGIRKRFSMPVPVPRTPVARGVVFEDANGNGRRDPGEPALSGVAVLLGPLRTTTDDRGEFSFFAEAGRGGRLHVDAATLGNRMLVPPGAAPRATGSSAIPVVRTAALRIRLFLDANGNGERDPGEERAPDARLTLTDADGRKRDAAADARGIVDFGALVPGDYTLTVYGTGRLGRRLPPTTRTVSVEPGGRASLRAPVPYRPLEIRFKSSAGGQSASGGG